MTIRRATGAELRKAVALGLTAALALASAPAAGAAEPGGGTTPTPHQLVFGYDTSGQTATGAPAGSLLAEPSLVLQPSGEPFVTLSTTSEHGLGIDTAGAVWAWGENTYGALGRSPAELPSSIEPVRVGKLPDVRFLEVAAGEAWSAALTDDGRVFTWGWGASGQLGNGTTTGTDEANPDPVRVAFPDGRPVQSIQAGELFGAAHLTDGTVWTWGDNVYGQLGGGPDVPIIRNVPGPVMLPENVDVFAQISVASISMTAVTNGGSLYGWGSNVNGNIAVGSFSGEGGALPDIVDRPTASHLPEGVTFLATKVEDFVGFGIGDDDRLWVWGSNEAGLFGDGGAAPDRTHPEPVAWPDGAEATGQVGCSELACAALARDGRVFVWGDRASGWFGSDTTAGVAGKTVVPFTEALPVSHLYVGTDNPFVIATAELPRIAAEALAPARQHEEYSARIGTSGTPLVSTAVVAGALPDGLHLGAGGELRGTPKASGEHEFTVRATSVAGTVEHVFRLRVEPAAPHHDGGHGGGEDKGEGGDKGGHHDGEHELAATGAVADGRSAALGLLGALALLGGVLAVGARRGDFSPRRRP
jgi:alpha-tubulin suppressor-like RCC1 family protein